MLGPLSSWVNPLSEDEKKGFELNEETQGDWEWES
jgi:hypothetical protein